jgi:hypothetical protein
MRNTLLGQCFHTRNEKIHKDILDLFPPFLQACLDTILPSSLPWALHQWFFIPLVIYTINCAMYFSWHYWCAEVYLSSPLRLCKMGNMKSNEGTSFISYSIKFPWAATSMFLQENLHARFLSLLYFHFKFLLWIVMLFISLMLSLIAVSDSPSYRTPRLQDEPTMPPLWMCSYVVCSVESSIFDDGHKLEALLPYW